MGIAFFFERLFSLLEKFKDFFPFFFFFFYFEFLGKRRSSAAPNAEQRAADVPQGLQDCLVVDSVI